MSVHTSGLMVWVYACGSQSLMSGVFLDHPPSYSLRHDLPIKQKVSHIVNLGNQFVH